ncbi:MAG TPA: CBASS cGAMP-activated phospholipase [Xanthobacteraceae bacterium]|jgi:patatin-like phospholipase/acyl hydrolase
MNYVPPRRSDGTIQRRRNPLPWPNDRPFRILTIDGGGICGILPAAVLAELERRFLGGRSISGFFDMIAGTSTGGIIALALGAGITSAAIRDIYIERGGLIFPSRGWVARQMLQLRRLVRYGYDAKALEDELSRIFHSKVFGEATVRLCIPSFEGRHGEPWIYKTPHHPDYRNDRHEKMVMVGLATAAAPTFFRSLEHDGYMMVDGGLWANNPIMNAVVDVLACFDLNRAQIHVLSLGCGETQYRVTQRRAAGGLFQWRDVIRAAMRAQSLNALGQAYLLVGKDHVLRIDAPESLNPIALDDYARAKQELPNMARSLVEGAGREIESVFLTNPADPYVPCPVCA